jgi:predicted transcriptional regulator
MNDRRSRMSIYIDILRVVATKQKAKPTHILYGANLSSARLKKYLAIMTSSGLLKEVSEADKIFYILTPKGREFLNESKKIEKFSEAFGVTF